MNPAFFMSLLCLIYVANWPFEANLPIAGFGQLGLRNLRALARFRSRSTKSSNPSAIMPVGGQIFEPCALLALVGQILEPLRPSGAERPNPRTLRVPVAGRPNLSIRGMKNPKTNPAFFTVDFRLTSWLKIGHLRPTCL